MTMKELQGELTRSVQGLERIAQEMYNRGLGSEWSRMEEAITQVGQVCLVFLDETAIQNLPEISDVERPEPVLS